MYQWHRLIVSVCLGLVFALVMGIHCPSFVKLLIPAVHTKVVDVRSRKKSVYVHIKMPALVMLKYLSKASVEKHNMIATFTITQYGIPLCNSFPCPTGPILSSKDG